MRRLALVLLVGPLVLASCAGGGAGADDGAQSVRGVVLRGPMCPVEQAGSPCPDEPVAGATITVLRGGRVVASATSGAVGRFEIALDPGRYTLEVDPGPAGMFAKPVEVRVRAGTTVEVTLLVDTGIR